MENNTFITLNGHQLRDALAFVAPDGDPEQLDTEICLQWFPDRKSREDGSLMKAGLYVWLAEYPEEGSYGPLDEVWTPPKPTFEVPENGKLVAHDTGDGWHFGIQDKVSGDEITTIEEWPDSWPPVVSRSFLIKQGFEVV